MIPSNYQQSVYHPVFIFSFGSFVGDFSCVTPKITHIYHIKRVIGLKGYRCLYNAFIIS